jgi:phage shock protein B
MNHATPEEIHDHAYGFRVSEHLSACAECRRSADAVAAEREILKDVLREDAMEAPAELLIGIKESRASRRRMSAPALAAADLGIAIGSGLFVLIIIFMTVVLPIVIIMHYVTKWKATKGLSDDEQRLLEDLWKDGHAMQSRLNALETILDDEVPDWRKKL